MVEASPGGVALAKKKMENKVENQMVEQSGGYVAQGMTGVQQSRAIAETQAMFALAKRFPRDSTQAYNRIIKACQRKSLAEQAKYVYPRGGQTVEGETIRLLEAIAQCWGNLDFGVTVVDQRDEETVVMAYAIDLETNVRRQMTFTVRHVRDTRQGRKILTDERDIYELMSNMGSRRLRKCLEGIIPADIIEAAADECEKTLRSGSKEPIEDRARKMVVMFGDFGVTQEMIEKKLGHNMAAIIEQEIITLGKIYRSLKDSMSSREQWFDVGDATKQQPEEGTGAAALNAASKAKGKVIKKDENPAQAAAPIQEDMGTKE